MSSKYDDKVIIAEMIKIIDKLGIYLGGIEVENANVESLTIEAIAFNFQLFSTFSKRVSVKVRKNSNIKWHVLDLYGEVLIHKTFGIEFKVMIEIISNEFKGLKAELINTIEKI